MLNTRRVQNLDAIDAGPHRAAWHAPCSVSGASCPELHDVPKRYVPPNRSPQRPMPRHNPPPNHAPARQVPPRHVPQRHDPARQVPPRHVPKDAARRSATGSAGHRAPDRRAPITRRRGGLSSALPSLIWAAALAGASLAATAASAAPSPVLVAPTGVAKPAKPQTMLRGVHDPVGIDHLIWINAGGYGHWFTDRDPLADGTPVVLGLGYATTRRHARLSWRAELYTGANQGATPQFLYVDLFSADKLLADGPVRPWWRIAFGFGLDLVGTSKGLGANGYFNADNGPSAGVGLTHAWGVDWELGNVVLRAEAGVRAYGGAGRTQAMAQGLLGVGYVFRSAQQ